VSRRNIDADALKVLRRLREHGWTAYLVGGGVRDLLLGLTPKDFDISTDAHPNQIKKLFRNCFLVGRRFRLAHIRFGRDKVIEASTFRRQPESVDDTAHPDADLYHHRDNTFGTPEEDARRRDFTINGLFYDPGDFRVIDHVGGLADLKKGIIRCIGDPNIRFREDPVRMLRAVRFASRLGFRIEGASFKAIKRHAKEMTKAAPARMIEEIYKLFSFQSAEAAFHLLRETGLMKVMFPEIDRYLNRHGGKNAPLWRYLAALDSGEHWHGDPTPALKFAALYEAPVRARISSGARKQQERMHPDAVTSLLRDATTRYKMPKRVFQTLVRMICDQDRFDSVGLAASNKRSRPRFSKPRFMSQDVFPEAFALFELRAAAGEADPHLVTQWRGMIRDSGMEKSLSHAAKRAGSRPPRRRRPRKRPPRKETTDA